MDSIGERLKIARTAVNLSIPEVSERTGISKGNLSKLENNINKPSAEALISLSDLYRVSTDWILKGESFAELPSNTDQAILVPDKKLRKFLQLLVKLWTNGNRDIKGWIMIQLSKAFPEVEEEIKKRDEQAAGADIA